MTHLEINPRFNQISEPCLDIKQLLECAPQLQVLKILQFSKITCDVQSKTTKKPIEDIRLNKLHISREVCEKSLKYIIESLLKRVSDLYFEVDNIIPDVEHSEEKSKKILDDLETSVKGIEIIYVTCTCYDKSLNLNRNGDALLQKYRSNEDSSDEYSSDEDRYDDYDAHISYRDYVDDPDFYGSD